MADKTQKIVFTADAHYGTVPPVYYKAGQVETMSEDMAGRWLRRGVASDDAELIAKAEADAAPPPAAERPTAPSGRRSNFGTKAAESDKPAGN